MKQPCEDEASEDSFLGHKCPSPVDILGTVDLKICLFVPHGKEIWSQEKRSFSIFVDFKYLKQNTWILWIVDGWGFEDVKHLNHLLTSKNDGEPEVEESNDVEGSPETWPQQDVDHDDQRNGIEIHNQNHHHHQSYIFQQSRHFSDLETSQLKQVVLSMASLPNTTDLY